MKFHELLVSKIDAANNVPLKQLAQIAGCDVATLWKWRNGVSTPSDIVAFARLADFLDISIQDLLNCK